MSTVADFFASLPPSSGSPRGLSTLAKSETCSQREVWMRQPGAPVIEGNTQAKRGTLFHALWDRHLPIDTPEGDFGDAKSPGSRAWILYKAYRAFWGSPEERFGCEFAGSEVGLEWAGVTARIDRLMRVVDPSKLLEYGVMVAAGDYLIHDFKTADSAKKAAYYMHGLQARYYPQMWNADPTRPHVKGILFDECIDHATPRKVADKKGSASYNVYWTPEAFEPELVLESLAEWSALDRARVQNPTKNRSACVSMFGDVCPFFNDCHKGL